MSNEIINRMQSITPTDLGMAMIAEIAAGNMPQIDAPLEHFHAFGLYGRRIFVPADSVVVTMRHLQQHLTIALKGRCTVVDEQGNRREVIAPAVWVTEPGTQRSVYAHDDVEWITVHHTFLTDVDELMKNLAEDPFVEAKKNMIDRIEMARISEDLT